MRLSTRIALAIGLSVPLLVLAFGWVLLTMLTGDLRAQQGSQLSARATVITRNAKNFLQVAGGNRPVVEKTRRHRLVSSAVDVGFRLTGPHGTLSAGPQAGASVKLPSSAPQPVIVTSGEAEWWVMSRRVGAVPQDDGPNLWLFLPDTTYKAQVKLVRSRVLTGALLAAPLAGATAWLIATRAAVPLRRLQQRTSGLDPRTSTARLEHTPTRIAEVDDLALTLQTVLARYDEQVARTGEALETARSFAASASHELRTPLMSMRTNLDILTEHPDLDSTDRAEVLEDLGHEHTRLLGLLVMLKALAQGDLVEAEAFSSLDFGELVDASVSDLRRTRPDAQVSAHTTGGLLVYGWEQGLRSAVDNLLTNAWTHGRASDGVASIEVTLRPSRDPHQPAAVLTIDDHGPGIPPERRQEVFQRFLRGPDSPGSGLGLTLVAQQIALHRGSITISDRPDGQPGTRFEVRLAATGVQDMQNTLHTLPLMRRDWLIGTPSDKRTPQQADSRH
ncbi:sensor histidine kinase [Streptomyces sp. NPDC050523]|uniref:sensor histidine kinase n=1 Tax=Streptomyces sp. NPDC050523 TaxID=3365622 RepID=UPI0037A39A93